MTTTLPSPSPARRADVRHVVAATAAMFVSAADTYVIVLILPAMMFDFGIAVDQLQRAAPLISGFLAGYIALMPLLGRLSDVGGRVPVLAICMALFIAGCVITASATSVDSAIAGRAVQGLGGGGMVPLTLAMVADIWPAQQRSRPLGLVAAAQELGSVLGPLVGALIITFFSWRAVFWLNALLMTAIAVSLFLFARTRPAQPRASGRRDIAGIALLLLFVISALAAVAAPAVVVNDATFGALYAPLLGQIYVFAPIALLAIASAITLVVVEIRRRHRAVLDVAGALNMVRRVDWLGAVLIAVTLAAVVFVFASADPEHQVVSDSAWWLLPLGIVAAAAFVIRERAIATPLIDVRALRPAAAWGALLTNLFVGAGLMAALVDVPLFARTTAYPDSQLDAALVLLRLLIAVPIGAVCGGLICRRGRGFATLTALAMMASAAMFYVMTTWNDQSLTAPLFGVSVVHTSDAVLGLCGFGFGLAIAPVNAALLTSVAATWRGLSASLLVVARSTGMLVGIALLTALGLREFHRLVSGLASPQTLCPATPAHCARYDALTHNAAITELHVIFAGAAIACACASLCALLLLRGTHATDRPLGELLSGA